MLTASSLGNPSFLTDHNARYAYAAGAMVKGIASESLILRLARRGILGFFGTGGCSLARCADAIEALQRQLPPGAPWGVNFLHNFLFPEQEEALVDLLLARDVRHIEASAFIQVTPAIVRYRLTGAARDARGRARPRNRVMAKLSRPEVARQFIAPAPSEIVAALRAEGRITADEAALAPEIPLADDICAEADSGGHTDRRTAWTLVPQFLSLRDDIFAESGRAGRDLGAPVRVGAGGGLGTPAAIAAAFMLGADFVMTGSVNQCTPEAGTSDAVKDMLARTDIADFDMAPAGDMFEIGAKVQVLKRGTLFPGRAQRLFELYNRHAGLDDIPADTMREIEARYFGRSTAEVWAETAAYYQRAAPHELAAAKANPKKRMAMVFRWYFIHTNRLAMKGHPADRANYQIHCGPAMGALNRWLRGTDLEDWRARHVDHLADRLMEGAANVFSERVNEIQRKGRTGTSSPPGRPGGMSVAVGFGWG